MCNCENVEVGSHDAAVSVNLPPHMSVYADAREQKGLSRSITVDKCLVPEIHDLWTAGIHTRGCCCGHNRREPYICVAPQSIEKMKTMGYEVYYNPCRPKSEDAFVPKTITSA